MLIGANIFENVTPMLQRTKDLTFSFVKQEMVRFGNRFRKRMVKERMSGRPGIDAPKLAKGKNLSAWTKGDDLSNLTTTARITRILVKHEKGGPIFSRSGGYLFLQNRGGKWNATTTSSSNIFAKMRSVNIPARLGFRSLWNEVIPDERQRIKQAMNNAIKVAGERNVQNVIKII